MWEGVGDRTELQHTDPHSSGYHSLSLPFSWPLNQGPGGGQPLLGHFSHSSIFFPTDLNFLSPGLYNNLTPTYFPRASQFHSQFNPSTVKVASDLLISSTGCTYYLHRYISSFDSLAGSVVNIQHVPSWLKLFLYSFFIFFSSVSFPIVFMILGI